MNRLVGAVSAGAKGAAKQRCVFKIAEKPAHGVKRFRQMRAAAPVAAAQRGAVPGKPAQRRGRADGAAGVGANGGHSRSLLHAGRGAA